MAAPPPKSWTPVKYSQTQLGGGQTAQGVAYPGGLDLTTPSLRLQAGALRDVLNFEVAQFGGYARIEGYERFDGRFSPSQATYEIVQLASGTSSANPFIVDESAVDGLDLLDGAGASGDPFLPPVGSVVTQAVTGAFGTVIAAVTTSDTPPIFYLVLTGVSGVFDNVNVLITPRS